MHAQQTAAYYIGLMSGTSLDGVDAVLSRFGPNQKAQFLHAASVALPPELRARLLALNHSGPDELVGAARAAQALVQHYSLAVEQLLQQASLRPDAIAAIGAHGQTVRHLPAEGISIQINAPALLAEQTGIDVIADFRSRDLAAGGQGAPLVPPFHALLFAHSHPRAVVNIGGMANITVLAAHPPSLHSLNRPHSKDLKDGKPSLHSQKQYAEQPSDPDFFGFDCGPGNVLMDLWCQQHLQKAYDHNGQWAASGQFNQTLLDLLMAEPWLSLPPPKSTGRDLFNAQWLAQKLSLYGQPITAADVQATLLAFTAQSIAAAITQWAPQSQELIICGGGAHNSQLLAVIEQQLAAHNLVATVRSSTALGIEPQYIEAFAFAWLAYAYDQKISAGHPQVTGANKKTVLGARYFS